MSLDGFLTFIGLMIATYAILSPISRLRLRLNMYRQLVLGAVAATLVGVLEFYFELKSIAPEGLSPVFSFVDFQEQKPGFSNEEAAFLVVVAWLVLALLLHANAKPRAISLGTLETLSERLHDEGRYLELVELVGPYLKTTRRAIEKKLLGQRFHHWILNTHSNAVNPFFAMHNDDKPILPNWVAERIKPLASLVPARRKAYHAALDIEDLLLQSDGVRQLLVRLKPEFAMALMDRTGWSHDEFRTRFFRDALNYKASHFYKELKATQNFAKPVGFVIEPKSVLLTGFFGDAKVGAKYGIWKPVGDEAVRLIRADREYSKLLNGPCPYDEELWSDPTYNTIHFFDIMVTSAARQDVPDHMWLMYMSVIVRELEAIHDVTDDRVDLAAEFPTLGNRLIYEATRRLREWIRLVGDLPEDSSHLRPKNLRGLDGPSIPYWAAKDCLNAIRYVIKSERLTDAFVSGLLESYIRDVAALPKNGPVSQLRNMMVSELINGDPIYGRESLAGKIAKFAQNVDHVVLHDAPDFQKALKKQTSEF
ncbi:hypothetical protein [Roseibium aggregatum]|uniref:hypothetical protein n=1 Tax=Roseibium aggregatum TaxID=187304 RepID=UPI0025AC8E2E|nr:hypothetical protein [Roseibium aggregatum]WJS02462.1 hypothetical protein QUB73_25370 [Roseibium aggregatum]